MIAAIIAALRHPREVVAIELQPQLASMANRNAQLNRLSNLKVIEADLRARKIDGVAPASFDYVVTNPPYRAPLSGRESPNTGRRLARGAGGAGLQDFLAAAARYLCIGGKIALIFTAPRAAELIAEMKSRSLEPKRLRFVHSFADSPASTVLIEARKGARVEAQIEAPLILWRQSGEYTPEALAILNGRTLR